MLPKLTDLQKAKLSAIQEISKIFGFLLRKLKPILLLIVVFVCIASINSNNSSITPLRHEAMDMVASLYQILNKPAIWVEGVAFHITQASNAHKLLPQLTAENEELKQRIKSYVAMEEENNQLRNLLFLANNSLYSSISAKVVSENFNGSESKFLINAGKSSGITEGMAVINQDGLIGRIIEVAEHSARVMALQDEQSSIPVIIKPINKRGIISGISGFNKINAQIKYIKKEELSEGMEVITSGDGDLLPKDLFVGAVAKDRESIVPGFKLGNLDYVLVLKLKK